MKTFILVLALPFVFGLAHAQDETPAQTPSQNRAPMHDGQGPYGPQRGPGMMNDDEARKYREERREERREEMREHQQQRPYGPGYQREPNQPGPGPAQRPARPPQQ